MDWAKINKKIFLLSSTGFWILFVMIPVLSIPGNNLWFQLSNYSIIDHGLLVLFATLAGLNLSLQIYRLKGRGLFSGAASSASGVFAALIGTATCVSCAAPLFGFLGLGLASTLFIFRYQFYFLLLSVSIILFSIYFTIKSINKNEPLS